MIQITRLLPAFMITLLVVNMGCQDVTVESMWYDTSAENADYQEWNSLLQHIDHIDSMFGVMNDAQALRIGLVPFSREIMAQVAGVGCIVWFNEEDRDARFGIRYPQGNIEIATRMLRNITKSETEVQLADLAECDTTLTLIGSDRKSETILNFDEAEALGIIPTISDYHGRLLLSLRVPFEFTLNDTVYEINRTDERSVTMLIETPTPERQNGRGSAPMGAPSGIDDDPYIRQTSTRREQSPQQFRGLNSPINLNLVLYLAEQYH